MKYCPTKIHTKVRQFLSIFLVLLLTIAYTASISSAEEVGYHAQNTLDDSELTSPYTSQNQFSGGTVNSVAFDFHIFAEEVTLGAHTNGNIATNTLHAGNHAFGAKTRNYLNKREDNYIGKCADGITNIGSNGYTVIGNAVTAQANAQEKRITIGSGSNPLDQETSKKIYKESENSSAYIDIAAELDHLGDISRSFGTKKTSADVTLGSVSGEQQTLSVSETGGNHYLSVSASEISGTSKRIINISLPANTTLVVNVDMAGSSPDCLANLVINLNGYSNGETIIENYCGLIWNLYDSSSPDGLFHTQNYACVGTSDYFFGTILAPAAAIKYGAVNGSIIAKKTCQNGQESHRFDFTGYEEPDEPTSEEPTSEEPTSEEPTSETPTSEEPTSETPTSEEPTSETPTSEEPTSETPTSEEPTSETPTSEEPTSETPTSEEPTSETPTSEEPTSETPTSEEPTSETPTSEASTSEIATSETAATTEGSTKSKNSKSVTNNTTTIIKAQPSNSSNTTNPKTGDTFPLIPIALTGMAAFAVFAALMIRFFCNRKAEDDNSQD